MSHGPLHLTIEGDECLLCTECGRYIKNAVAFIRARAVYDKPQRRWYTVGVVCCGKCEVATRSTEQEAENE